MEEQVLRFISEHKEGAEFSEIRDKLVLSNFEALAFLRILSKQGLIRKLPGKNVFVKKEQLPLPL
jgi:DNA-binding MarR family transcriptional regulator